MEVSYALMGVGVALVILAVVLGIKYRADLKEHAPEVFTAGAMGLTLLLGGLAYKNWEVTEVTRDETTRLLVLILGGLLGFFLTAMAIWRGVLWWKYVSGGLEVWQGKEGWRLWVVVGVTLLGLAVLFASLLLARREEEENPTLRRLLYGYVAALTGLLLLLTLIVINVLAYLYMPEPSDWTSSKLYTLSDQSRRILKGIDKPVKVYFLLASRRQSDGRHPGYYSDVSTLLENMRGVTEKVQTEIVLRDINLGRLSELAREFQLTEAEGLLVVYDPDGDKAHHFIRKDELYDVPTGRGRRAPFKGENELTSAINRLSEGKSKATVYFTQGSGELDIGVGGEAGRRADRRAMALVDRLRHSNFEVKGLRLEPGGAKEGGSPNLVVSDRVPDDATIVVVAGPQRPLLPDAVAALRRYMQERKGKLMVLAGVVPGPDGKMANLGLEGLLSEYDVELGNGRILQFSDRYPTRVQVATVGGPDDKNPVASVLDRYVLDWVDVRPVRPRRGGPARPGGGSFRPEALLETNESFVWSEDNLLEDPGQMIQNLLKTEEGKKKLVAKRSPEQLPVAVLVSDSSMPDLPDRHPDVGGRGQTPRLVVIGNDTFASDANLGEGAGRVVGELHYILFAGSLAWLREKPDTIGIEARTRKDYQMDPDTNLTRMILLPGALMALCVVGLGLGIWVVRRR
jgi:hypothetical protein